MDTEVSPLSTEKKGRERKEDGGDLNFFSSLSLLVCCLIFEVSCLYREKE
jgi:hypothetical protein